jgi:hypothetical protein
MIDIIPYTPSKRVRPARYLEGWPTSWHPNEDILEDILERFNVERHSALEVGSEHGHSAIALSNFFDKVVCVDPWQQQITDQSRPMWDCVRENVAPYSNISLFRMEWQEFIKQPGVSDLRWSLCHYDGYHDYEQTFACGLWMAERSPVVLFHDSHNSFTEVVPAICAIAEKLGRRFYNFEEEEGLGILV